MASINGFVGNLTGTTGATGYLEPKSGWYVYVLERGAHASAASSSTTITFDSSASASRFAALDWVQVGTDTSKIRQVSTVSSNTIIVNSAVSVSIGDRILNCGTTQPVVANGLATYTPTTTIYSRDDDAGTAVTDSKVQTDSTGQYQFWTTDGLYDLLSQDASGANQLLLADLPIGLGAGGNLVPATTGIYDIGSSSAFWDDIYYDGSIISGHTSVTGSTVFNFIDATGVTAGNLFSMALNDSVKIYGDTHGGVFNSWTLPEYINVKSAKYGARGDDSTDDSTAIQNALNDAAIATSGASSYTVVMPRGAYRIAAQINVPARVRLLGLGARKGTIIKAHGSFPSSTAMVYLGSASVNSPGSLIENLTIDCNSVSGSIGVFATRIQEGGGCRDITVMSPGSHAYHISTTNSSNFDIERCFAQMQQTADTSRIGLFLDSTSGIANVDRFGVGSITGASVLSYGAGIFCSHSSGVPARLSNLHFEQCVTGVSINSPGNVSVNTIYGNDTCQNLVYIGASANNISIDGLFRAASPVGLSDNNTGYFAATDVAYYRSSGGSAGRQVISGQSSHRWQVHNHIQAGTTLTVDGQFGVTGLATIAQANFGATVAHNSTVFGSSMVVLTVGTNITFPAGNVFGTSTAPAGTTTTTSITTTGQNGRRVTLLGWLGTLTLTDGAGIDLDGGTNKTLAPGDRLELMCVGSTWYQMYAKATS